MLAVLGGLGAAVAWAVSTLCSSRSSRMMEPMAVVALIMVVGLVITAPIAAVHGVPSFDAESLTWLVISGAGNVGGLVLAYKALRIGQVALVAPLVSTEGAITATIALLAGESLAPGVGLALAIVAVGVCLSAVPESAKTERRLVHDQPASVLLAVAAALVFGTSLYATGRAATTLPSTWVVLSARLIGTVALAVPLAVAGRLRVRAPSDPACRRGGNVRGARVLLLHRRCPARDRCGCGALLAVCDDRGGRRVLPVPRAPQPRAAGGRQQRDRRGRAAQRVARVNSSACASRSATATAPCSAA